MKKKQLPHKKPNNTDKLHLQITKLENKINELKKENDLLEDKNNFLEEIISILPGHVYWKDRNGILLGCNNSQALAAGLKSRQDIVGLKPIDLIKKDQPRLERINQAKAIEEVDRQVIKTNRTLSVEEQAVLQDGSIGYFISEKAPLHNKRGNTTGLVGVTLDITSQKNLEKQLDKANQNKSRFIINIGTLVRDSLSSLLGTTQVLNQTRLTNKQKRCTEIIIESINKIMPILDRLYDYVDLEDNNLPVVNSTFNLKDFFNDLQDEYQPLAHEKSLQLSFEHDKSLPQWVEGAKYFISQAINNLLSNAIKYTSKGFIKVTTKKASPIKAGHFDLRIIIEDTGKGIDQSALKDLFSLFDGDIEREALFVRAGLDLSISAKMLQLINANIEVSSKVRKGTTFTITIPLKKGIPAKQPSLDIMDVYHINESKAHFVKPTDTLINVLILDNDLLWQKALKLMLEDAYNCKIEHIDNLKEANRILNKEYDIIFLDVGSPNDDFLQFSMKYKNRHKRHAPPIIVTTACASDEQRELINTAEVTDIIAKPVDYYTLIGIIDYYVFQDYSENKQ